MATFPVRQCACGVWFNVTPQHTDEKVCKTCRVVAQAKKVRRRPKASKPKDAPRDEDNWRDNLGESED